MHEILQNLSKTALVSVTRTLDMAQLHFEHTINSVIMEYSLHVMCVYRMLDKHEMLFGKGDLLYPSLKVAEHEAFSADTFFEEGSDLFYMDFGNNHLDEILANKFTKVNIPVSNIVVSDIGDLFIYFDQGYIFEAYIDNRFGE